MKQDAPAAQRRAEAALIVNTIIWGATFVLVKQALRDVSPVLFLALRFTLATVVLVVLFRGAWSASTKSALVVDRRRDRRRIPVRRIRLSNHRPAIHYRSEIRLSHWTHGGDDAAAGRACVYRKKPRALEIGGVLLATGGMALMTLPGAGGAINRGDLLTICCAACYAAHILTLSRYSATASFELLATAQIGISALLAWSLFHAMETPHIRWTLGVWAAIAITGIFATALAFTFQAWAQRYTTSTRTALIFMLEPVFAWITSYLLTGESLSARAAAGAGLILTGILVVEVKPWRQAG